MSFTVIFILCAVGGYLLGSIPFGLVLTRLAGYGDIRKIGSGNIGATNVLRTGNKTLALLTVILDAFKPVSPPIWRKSWFRMNFALYSACRLQPQS